MFLEEKVVKYFKRLGLNSEQFVEANFGNLAKLSMVHKVKVPFENLDTFTGVRSIMEM